MSTSSVPAFITKLWNLVEDPLTDEFICWDITGKRFHVFDQVRFSKEILPLYFKHNNISSFIRQLNLYGFKKVLTLDQGALKTEHDTMVFAHNRFIKGREDLLDEIKRKPPTSSVNRDSNATAIGSSQLSNLITSVESMGHTQATLSKDFNTMKRDQSAMWRELSSLKQKNAKQQQVISKLLQFLVSLVGNNRELSNTYKRTLPQLMIADAPANTSYSAKRAKYATTANSQGGLVEPGTSGVDLGNSIIIQDVTGLAASPPVADVTGIVSSPATTDFAGNVSSSAADLIGNVSSPINVVTIANSAGTAVSTNNQPTASAVTTGSTLPVLRLAPVSSGKTQSVPVLKPKGKGGKAKAAATKNTHSNVGTKRPSLLIPKREPPPVSESRTAPEPAVPAVPNMDIADTIEKLELNLDEVKDLLAKNPYSLDTSTLNGLFTPEAPMPTTPDHLLSQIAFPNLQPSYGLSDSTPLMPVTEASMNTGNIVGNELIEYTKDMPPIFELPDIEEPVAADSSLNCPLDTPSLPQEPTLEDTSLSLPLDMPSLPQEPILEDTSLNLPLDTPVLSPEPVAEDTSLNRPLNTPILSLAGNDSENIDFTLDQLNNDGLL